MNNINKKYIENFLVFCGHKLENFQRINNTINNFLIRLKEGVFEIPLKIGKIEYKQRVLWFFCRFAFNGNFVSYQLTYYSKIYPYICKETYSKKLKQL